MTDPRDDLVVEPLVPLVPLLAREDPDRRPAGRVGAAGSRSHHLAETARHDSAAALGQQTPDLLRERLVLAPAADDCDLHPRHGAIVEP